jgi:L-aspartate oxidase
MDLQRLPDGAVLIVGAGLAGLFLALKLAPRRCVVLSPAPIGQAASSAWAQGGLAAALAPEDSPQSHALDTINAGVGLVDPLIAMLIATEGPARVRDLLDIGVPFDKNPDGSLALSMEAAHSHARVARVAGDLAGREIMSSLIKVVRASDHITLVEGIGARGLLQQSNGQIGGIFAQNGREVCVEADETVFATGGSGGLFAITTNPVEAAGQGLGMAIRCGALVSDLEFVQFHPTAIDIGKDPAPLATEALRGDGAILVNRDMVPFMVRYHALKDLAPRDIVARAVALEAASDRGAFLDCTKAIGGHFPEAFPTVFASCMAANIDPRIASIPVAPAAHYHMGGIVTDMWGKTSLEGLSAIGECASTGVHGANRLASNSLLEAVVFANRTAERLRDSPSNGRAGGTYQEGFALTPGNRQNLRQAMSRFAGVVRNGEGLTTLLDVIDDIKANNGPTNELVTAHCIVTSALARTESRGGHFRADYPDANQVAKRSFVTLEGTE